MSDTPRTPRTRLLEARNAQRRRAGGLVALGLLVGIACAPAETRPRVVVVGIDGASWTVIGPLLERGELPAFRQLVRESAHTLALGDIGTTLSPVVWTSIATGRLPETHGIRGFVVRLGDGKRIPVGSSQRAARAVWEIASGAGVETGVIGWWASWPAEPIAGYVISEHANPAAVGWLGARPWGPGRQRLEGIERAVHPEELSPRLRPHWLDREDFPWPELRARSGLTDAQMEVLRRAPWDGHGPYAYFKTFYAIDRPLVSIALELLRERPTDLLMLYLRGPDPIQHRAWDLFEPERFARKPPYLERDRGLVEGVYRYVDSFLGEILAAVGDATLIVLSDHGAEPSPEAADPERTTRPGEHGVDARGVLFVRGPGVRPGPGLEAGPLDVAPTVAWLLGLPVADDLPGRILAEAFEPGFARRLPRQRVASWGARPVTPGMPSEADAARLEQLRGLGYIE